MWLLKAFCVWLCIRAVAVEAFWNKGYHQGALVTETGKELLPPSPAVSCQAKPSQGEEHEPLGRHRPHLLCLLRR